MTHFHRPVTRTNENTLADSGHQLQHTSYALSSPAFSLLRGSPVSSRALGQESDDLSSSPDSGVFPCFSSVNGTVVFPQRWAVMWTKGEPVWGTCFVGCDKWEVAGWWTFCPALGDNLARVTAQGPLCPWETPWLIPQACSILLLVLCFLIKSLQLGKMEFAGKRGAIISVLCEWETELDEWQISW